MIDAMSHRAARRPAGPRLATHCLAAHCLAALILGAPFAPGSSASGSSPLFVAEASAQTTRKPGAGADLTFDLPQRAANTPQGLVELIASSEQPSATGELWVALRYQLQPGWHIYWRNPGDSGGPPQVQWQLPAGAKAGEFEFPPPSRIPLERLMNFGYENEVVLPLKLTLPPAARPGKPLHVGAALKWLVCKDICVSGKADLALDLPLSSAERTQMAGWAKDIAAARAATPQPAPKAWRASTRVEPDALILTVLLDRPAPAKAHFFPLDKNVIENAAPQEVTASGKELRIKLRKADRQEKAPTQLRGVLTFPTGPSVSIVAPVGS